LDRGRKAATKVAASLAGTPDHQHCSVARRKHGLLRPAAACSLAKPALSHGHIRSLARSARLQSCREAGTVACLAQGAESAQGALEGGGERGGPAAAPGGRSVLGRHLCSTFGRPFFVLPPPSSHPLLARRLSAVTLGETLGMSSSAQGPPPALAAPAPSAPMSLDPKSGGLAMRPGGPKGQDGTLQAHAGGATEAGVEGRDLPPLRLAPLTQEQVKRFTIGGASSAGTSMGKPLSSIGHGGRRKWPRPSTP